MLESLHAALKRSTADAHARLDDLVGSYDLLRDAEGLVAFLRVHLDIAELWEPRLQASLPAPALAFASQAARIEWLRADLERWSPQWRADPLGPNPQTVVRPDADAAWGAAYVIEGSALGGRVLARRVASALGVSEASLGSLHGHGSQTAERWKGFCAALNDSGADESRASAAAADVFGAFEGKLLRAVPRLRLEDREPTER